MNFDDLTGAIFTTKKLHMCEMLYIIHNMDVKITKILSEGLNHHWSALDSLIRDFKRNLAQNTGDPILTDED